jgi:thioredoxin-related protein
MGRKLMPMIAKSLAAWLLLLLVLSSGAFSADDLKLNPKLDYNSDSQDGPLITADNSSAGAVKGQVNYIIIFQEGCFNSKRQARRSTSLYEKYKDRVNFVVVDLDRKVSSAQRELVDKYFRGYIPHVVILNKSGKAIYDDSGEVEESKVASILSKALDDRSSQR